MWDQRLWEAAAQVRQARAARAVSGGGRSAWAQAWRSQRQWEAEHRRGSTAEAVAGGGAVLVREVGTVPLARVAGGNGVLEWSQPVEPETSETLDQSDRRIPNGASSLFDQ